MIIKSDKGLKNRRSPFFDNLNGKTAAVLDLRTTVLRLSSCIAEKEKLSLGAQEELAQVRLSGDITGPLKFSIMSEHIHETCIGIYI